MMSRSGWKPAKLRAFRTLFSARMFTAICRWLRRLRVPESDLLDVAHEVLLAALRGFQRYDPRRGRLRSWLHRIAVHKAAHWHDRAFRRREVLGLDGAPELPDPALVVDEQIERQEVRAFVFDCLQELPVDLRQVLIPYELDGIPLREIAESLGVPLSKVQKRHAKGRRALKALLLGRMREEQGIMGDPRRTYH